MRTKKEIEMELKDRQLFAESSSQYMKGFDDAFIVALKWVLRI